MNHPRRCPWRARVITASALVTALSGCSAATPDDPFAALCGPVTVTDVDGLHRAVAEAGPGDTITVAPGTYRGHLAVTSSGTAARPITLCGTSETVLDGGPTDTGYTLHLDGASHWTLRGFTVTGGQKGVMLDAASHNRLLALRVHAVGDEGVHLRTGSSHNLVQGLTVTDTGLHQPAYGEGIYVGTAESNWCDVTACSPDRSDHNRILDNDVSKTTAEAVDVKEGTSRGELRGNRLGAPHGTHTDSTVDLKGNDWVVRGNHIEAGTDAGVQVHVVRAGWGRGNRIVRNSFELGAGRRSVVLVGAADRADNLVACRQPRTNETADESAGEPSNASCG